MRFPEPILHVDMDAFFVEVERLRDPDLRNRPVVVGGSGDRGVVASASYEARAFGVRSAMPMMRARTLCPDLVAVPPDHAEYRRRSEQVFEIFWATSPLVEGLSLDEAFLDVGGLHHHYEHPRDIAEQLRRAIRGRLGLPASVGIASTKFVAKLASDAAKPDGVMHIPVEATTDFLWKLPVRALWGVGEATHASLVQLGVETVGDLAALDQRTLRRAVGNALGRHLGELAHGIDPRPVEPDSDVKSVSVEQTYERDLTTIEEVVTALRTHSDRVTSRARRSKVAGRTITLKVRFGDFRTITRSETLPEATATDVVVFRVVQRLFDRIDWQGRGIRLLGVGLSGLVEGDAPRQLVVGEDDRWSRVAEAVDQVRLRYGSASVKPARLHDDPRSQKSTRTYTE